MPEPTPSQKEIHDIFHREDYFYCIRERCSMRKTLCIQYQKEAAKKLHCKYGSYLLREIPMKASERANCWGCEQGRLIKQELKEKGIIK